MNPNEVIERHYGPSWCHFIPVLPPLLSLSDTYALGVRTRALVIGPICGWSLSLCIGHSVK